MLSLKRLLLDLSGNGGGDVCLGYMTIARLVNDAFPEGVYDLIRSPLWDLFTEKVPSHSTILRSNPYPYNLTGYLFGQPLP